MRRLEREKRIEKEEKDYFYSLISMIVGSILFGIALACIILIENIGLACISFFFLGLLSIAIFGFGLSYFWGKAKEYVSLFLSKKGVWIHTFLNGILKDLKTWQKL